MNDPKTYQDMVKDMPVFENVEWDKETNKVASVGTKKLKEYAEKQSGDFWFRFYEGGGDIGNSVPFEWGHHLVGFVARSDTEFYTRFVGGVVFEKTLKKGEVCLALENMYTIPYVYDERGYTEQMYYKGDVDIIFYYNQKPELPLNQEFVTTSGVYTYSTNTQNDGCIWHYKHTGGFETNIQEYCPLGSLSYGLLPELVSEE